MFKLNFYTNIFTMIISYASIISASNNQTICTNISTKAQTTPKFFVLNKHIPVEQLRTLIAGYLYQQPRCIQKYTLAEALIPQNSEIPFEIHTASISLASYSEPYARYVVCDKNGHLASMKINIRETFDKSYVRITDRTTCGYDFLCQSANLAYSAVLEKSMSYDKDTIHVVHHNDNKTCIIQQLLAPRQIRKFQLSPDGSYFAITIGNQLFVYKKNENQKYVNPHHIQLPTDDVPNYMYAADKYVIIAYGSSIYSDPQELQIKLYKITTEGLIPAQAITEPIVGSVTALQYNSDRGDIVVGLDTGAIIVYSLENNIYKAKTLRAPSKKMLNAFIHVPNAPEDNHEIKAISYSPEKNYLAAALPNKSIAFWKYTQSGYNQCDYTIPCTDDIIALVFLDNDTVLLYTASHSFETWILPSELHANN
jgi:WD40 repeat protein